MRCTHVLVLAVEPETHVFASLINNYCDCTMQQSKAYKSGWYIERIGSVDLVRFARLHHVHYSLIKDGHICVVKNRIVDRPTLF